MNCLIETYLYPSQSIPINIVVLNKSTAFSEYVDATLMSVVYLIAPNRRVTVRRDPNSSKVIGVYLIVNELAKARFVDVDASCLSVVNLTMNYGGVSAGLHFEPGDSIVVNVVGFKVTL